MCVHNSVHVCRFTDFVVSPSDGQAEIYHTFNFVDFILLTKVTKISCVHKMRVLQQALCRLTFYLEESCSVMIWRSDMQWVIVCSSQAVFLT